jgi:hypothetical protein
MMLALAAQPDSVVHVSAGALAAAAGYAIGTELGGEVPRLAIGAVFGLGAAAAKELADVWIGEPSAIDFAFSAGGVAIGLLLAWAIDRWLREPALPLWQTLDSGL